MLIQAISELYGIDGFTKVMKLAIVNVHNASSFKGYVYEIETGYNIAKQSNNEKIIGFQKKLTSPTSRIQREFDLVTTHRLIECKNINWANNKIHRQIELQKQITDEINNYNELKLTYELCSKKPIPLTEKRWLKKRNIAYSYDNDKE